MTKKLSSRSKKGVAQEHTMGCAVACVAYRTNLTYQTALKNFSTPQHAWTRGFYCSEIVEALEKIGFSYSYSKYNEKKHSDYLKKNGTIIFVARCEEFPYGHFMVQSSNGWMNPWSNYPLIKIIKADFQKKFPGVVEYILFET